MQPVALDTLGNPIGPRSRKDKFTRAGMKSSHNSLKVLAITHTEASSAPKFALTRLADGKSLAPVSVASPYSGLVDGRPNSNLMRELRWYLEGFLDYPF